MPTAISLQELGVTTTVDELLAKLLKSLTYYIDNPAQARHTLTTNSATLGHKVQVTQTTGDTFTGTALDLDELGRLIVDTTTGTRVIEAADVERLHSHNSHY